MGFIAFIIVLATLSAFFEAVDDIRFLAPYIAVFLAAVAGYRFTGRLIAQRKAAREKDDREELKEELRQEIREEMRAEKKKNPLPEIMQTKVSEEEPYYPETKYFHQQ